MTEQQTIGIAILKEKVDMLWKDIVALGKEYWSFYEEAFLSGEPYAPTKIKELYKQEEQPF